MSNQPVDREISPTPPCTLCSNQISHLQSDLLESQRLLRERDAEVERLTHENCEDRDLLRLAEREACAQLVHARIEWLHERYTATEHEAVEHELLRAEEAIRSRGVKP